MELTTRTELLARGHNDESIRQLVLRGAIIRLGRGRYGTALPDDPVLRHLMLARFEDEAVLTLETAALVHGLPLATVPRSLQLVLVGQRNRLRGRGRQIRGDQFADDEIVEMDGFTLTSLARTIVDLGRLRRIDDAIIPWEAALGRARGDKTLQHFEQLLTNTLDHSGGRRGIVACRELARFASPYSESPRESLSRLALSRLALPQPVQQYIVLDFNGKEIGRTDFAWPELGVLGEYDGQDKYDSLARRGEKPADVVRREKRRQERMESIGWIFARWGKEELASLDRLRERVERALRNGRNRGLGGSLPGRLAQLY